MSQAVHRVHFTFADYVALERTSNVKHEYLAGQIYAMAGGTPQHAALAAAVSGLLFAQLRGSACRVYSSDLRVHAGDLTTYPDVTVVCGSLQRHPQDPNTASNPRVVVEVSSPSTEEYDRTEKLEHYKQVPSLAALVIVSHDERHLQVWHRGEQGWVCSEVGPGQTVTLAAIDCALAVDEVYQAV